MGPHILAGLLTCAYLIFCLNLYPRVKAPKVDLVRSGRWVSSSLFPTGLATPALLIGLLRVTGQTWLVEALAVTLSALPSTPLKVGMASRKPTGSERASLSFGRYPK